MLVALALLIVVVALIAGGDRGRLRLWGAGRRRRGRIAIEDAVKHLHAGEADGRLTTADSLAGALQITTDAAAKLLAGLVAQGHVEVAGDRFELTTQGRAYARRIIRAHRLYERYLADETGLPELEWHAQAERREHALSPAEADALARRLGHPIYDPHGDPIPTAAGDVPPPAGRPLATLPPGEGLRIVHIEDEPKAVYAQLVAEGLRSGMEGRMTTVEGQGVVVELEGEEHTLTALAAANVFATPIGDEVRDSAGTVRLCDLGPGEAGTVVRISPRCRGAQRRRIMDLGIVPGTVVEAAFVSPTGDPVAYRVRSTLIALRSRQAADILVRREGQTPA